ncbi:MAG: HipA domain-containing protein [Lachnospiraceae bacterium]|nr:HipA domain-containing protein [Lachnospiraceae bacterium]
MIYELMRKDSSVMLLDFSESGDIRKIGKVFNPELVPLQDRISHKGIISWWRDRAIPIKQGKIEQMLSDHGIQTAGMFLLKNLGLSLTDYYWIKPLGSEISWNQVNLFSNDFKENLLVGNLRLHQDTNGSLEYQPNSSLQGNLEKTWIIDKGTRKLVKGNHTELSSESINEVIVSEAIKAQGKQAAAYDLLHIKGKSYDFGCISPMFTSLSLELVSAYAVITSEIKENHVSTYEHFINVCGKNGLDQNAVREYLEFEIQMDFIFSNRDRHLTNISVLRDADTLEFASMAPIYDSGKSMMVGKDIRKITDKLLLSQPAIGFADSELKLLNFVQNRGLVNIDLLPSPDRITELYKKDSQVPEERIRFVKEVYERKVDLYDKFQHGRDLTALKFASSTLS